MAQFFDLTVGSIIVIVLVVIVILWLVNRRRCQTQHAVKQYRQAVKTAIKQDFARVPVEHPRHSHSSSNTSSSSDSSSSDSHHHHDRDDLIFLPGGLGDFCNSNTCSTGLTCLDNRCACPRPIAPTVTAIKQGIDSILVNWNAVPQANYYDLILYRVTANDLVPVEVVRNFRGVTLTFDNLQPGTYRVEVTGGSDACGIVSGSNFGVAVVNNVGCETNAQCVGATPVCNLGACVQCTVDTQCAPGQRCQNNTCVQITGQGLNQPCVNNLNCAQGLACQNLLCVVSLPPQCQVNTDCPAGNVCTNGMCIPACPPPPTPTGFRTSIAGTRGIEVFWDPVPGAIYDLLWYFRSQATTNPYALARTDIGVVGTAALFRFPGPRDFRVELFAVNACGRSLQPAVIESYTIPD